MKKVIVFDTGPIISLTMNNLLWILEPLHREYRGTFYIPMAVKRELIDKPLQTRRFKFEALQIIPYISNGTLQVIENEAILSKTHELLDLANRIYKAKGSYIQIIQIGEMEALAAALYFEANSVVIDERITRMLIEDPQGVRDTLSRRLHAQISVDHANLSKFNQQVKHLRVIRSIELVTVAYELGILNKYMSIEQESFVRDVKEALLEGVLWGVKLNGCSVSREEIEDIISMEREAKRA